MKPFIQDSVYVTARLLTVDPFNRIINRSARFKTGRGHAESESGSISRTSWLESGSISRPSQLESGSISRLARSESGSRAVNGHWSIAFMCTIMKLPDTISLEPFQQCLAETFPEDGKCSTYGVVQEFIDSTVNACWKTLTALGKLPHVRKWLQLLPFVVGISRSASS